MNKPQVEVLQKRDSPCLAVVRGSSLPQVTKSLLVDAPVVSNGNGIIAGTKRIRADLPTNNNSVAVFDQNDAELLQQFNSSF